MTAATATAPGLEALREEIAALEAEIKTLTGKREVEEKTLASLNSEQTRLAESIARGETKRSAATDLKEKLEGSTAALVGFDSLLRGPMKRLDEAYGALRKIEQQTQRAMEIGEVTQIAMNAEALLIRIASNLEKTVGADLRSFQAECEKLDRIGRRAQINTFPIPPSAMAAMEARKRLDGIVRDKITPLLKVWR